MAAIVTDQFRILNANNFVETVDNSANSYYVVVGLTNPTSPSVGFGRSTTWNTNTPSPEDSFNYIYKKIKLKAMICMMITIHFVSKQYSIGKV